MTKSSSQVDLSPAAVAAWRELLAQPMPPSRMAEHAKTLSTALGDAFITSPASTWARESYLGARFANAVSAHAVWLQDRPDLGVIGADEVPRRYELTEALEPGRRRNAEYREDAARLAAGVSTARGYAPDNVESTKLALRTAASAKAQKAGGYGQETVGLIIYLNTDLHAFDDCVSLLEASLHDETAVAAEAFAEVWVLWAGRLYLLWREGRRADLSPLLDV